MAKINWGAIDTPPVTNERRALEETQNSGFTPVPHRKLEDLNKVSLDVRRGEPKTIPVGGRGRTTTYTPWEAEGSVDTSGFRAKAEGQGLPGLAYYGDPLFSVGGRKRTGGGGYGTLIKIGGLEVAQGLAALVESETGGLLGQGMRRGLEEDIAKAYESLAPEFQEALSREWATTSPEAAWKSPRSVTAQLAKQIPILASLVIPGGVGGALGRRAATRGAGFGAMAPAAQKAAVQKGITTGATAGGIAGEGTIIAGMTAAEIIGGIEQAPEENLMRHPTYAALRSQGLDEATARQQFLEEVGYEITQARSRTAGAGGAVLAAIPAAIFGKMLAGTAPRGMKGVGLAMLGEGATEAPQETFEQYQANLGAIATHDFNRDPLTGLGEAAVAGGVLGGLMGGGMAGIGSIGRRVMGVDRIGEGDRSGQIIGGGDVNAALNATAPPAGPAQMDMFGGLPPEAQGMAAPPQGVPGETQDMFGGPPGVPPESTVAPESAQQMDMFPVGEGFAPAASQYQAAKKEFADAQAKLAEYKNKTKRKKGEKRTPKQKEILEMQVFSLERAVTAAERKMEAAKAAMEGASTPDTIEQGELDLQAPTAPPLEKAGPKEARSTPPLTLQPTPSAKGEQARIAGLERSYKEAVRQLKEIRQKTPTPIKSEADKQRLNAAMSRAAQIKLRLDEAKGLTKKPEVQAEPEVSADQMDMFGGAGLAPDLKRVWKAATPPVEKLKAIVDGLKANFFALTERTPNRVEEARVSRALTGAKTRPQMKKALQDLARSLAASQEETGLVPKAQKAVKNRIAEVERRLQRAGGKNKQLQARLDTLKTVQKNIETFVEGDNKALLQAVLATYKDITGETLTVKDFQSTRELLEVLQGTRTRGKVTEAIASEEDFDLEAAVSELEEVFRGEEAAATKQETELEERERDVAYQTKQKGKEAQSLRTKAEELRAGRAWVSLNADERAQVSELLEEADTLGKLSAEEFVDAELEAEAEAQAQNRLLENQDEALEQEFQRGPQEGELEIAGAEQTTEESAVATSEALELEERAESLGELEEDRLSLVARPEGGFVQRGIENLRKLFQPRGIFASVPDGAKVAAGLDSREVLRNFYGTLGLVGASTSNETLSNIANASSSPDQAMRLMLVLFKTKVFTRAEAAQFMAAGDTQKLRLLGKKSEQLMRKVDFLTIGEAQNDIEQIDSKTDGDFRAMGQGRLRKFARAVIGGGALKPNGKPADTASVKDWIAELRYYADSMRTARGFMQTTLSMDALNTEEVRDTLLDVLSKGFDSRFDFTKSLKAAFSEGGLAGLVDSFAAKLEQLDNKAAAGRLFSDAFEQATKGKEFVAQNEMSLAEYANAVADAIDKGKRKAAATKAAETRRKKAINVRREAELAGLERLQERREITDAQLKRMDKLRRDLGDPTMELPADWGERFLSFVRTLDLFGSGRSGPTGIFGDSRPDVDKTAAWTPPKGRKMRLHLDERDVAHAFVKLVATASNRVAQQISLRTTLSALPQHELDRLAKGLGWEFDQRSPEGMLNYESSRSLPALVAALETSIKAFGEPFVSAEYFYNTYIPDFIINNGSAQALDNQLRKAPKALLQKFHAYLRGSKQISKTEVSMTKDQLIAGIFASDQVSQTMVEAEKAFAAQRTPVEGLNIDQRKISELDAQEKEGLLLMLDGMEDALRNILEFQNPSLGVRGSVAYSTSDARRRVMELRTQLSDNKLSKAIVHNVMNEIKSLARDVAIAEETLRTGKRPLESTRSPKKVTAGPTKFVKRDGKTVEVVPQSKGVPMYLDGERVINDETAVSAIASLSTPDISLTMTKEGPELTAAQKKKGMEKQEPGLLLSTSMDGPQVQETDLPAIKKWVDRIVGEKGATENKDSLRSYIRQAIVQLYSHPSARDEKSQMRGTTADFAPAQAMGREMIAGIRVADRLLGQKGKQVGSGTEQVTAVMFRLRDALGEYAGAKKMLTNPRHPKRLRLMRQISRLYNEAYNIIGEIGVVTLKVVGKESETTKVSTQLFKTMNRKERAKVHAAFRQWQIENPLTAKDASLEAKLEGQQAQFAVEEQAKGIKDRDAAYFNSDKRTVTLPEEQAQIAEDRFDNAVEMMDNPQAKLLPGEAVVGEMSERAAPVGAHLANNTQTRGLQEILSELKQNGLFGRLSKTIRQLFDASERNNINVPIEWVSSDDAFVGKYLFDAANPMAGRKILLNRTTYKLLADKHGQAYADSYLAHTLAHEVAHAQTMVGLETNPELAAELQELMDRAKVSLGTDYYAFTNLHEFIAETKVNAALRRDLQKINPDGSARSIWRRMIDAIARFLGADTSSLLDLIMDTSSALYMTEAQMQQAAKGMELGFDHLNMEVAFPDSTMTAVANIVDTNSEHVLKSIREATRYYAKKLTLPALTLDQIVESFRQQIPQVAEYVDRMQLKWAEVNKRLDSANVIVQRMAALPSEIREDLADIMFFATRYKMHPDQAFQKDGNAHLATSMKDNYNLLRGRWDALVKKSPQAIEVYSQVRDRLKADFEADVKARTLNVLTAMGVEESSLPDNWYKIISKEKSEIEFEGERTGVDALLEQMGIAGKFSREEITAFRRLTRRPRQIQGPYFPLRRDGKWVVRGKADVTITFANELEMGAELERVRNEDPGVQFIKDAKDKNDPNKEANPLKITLRFQTYERFHSLRLANKRRNELSNENIPSTTGDLAIAGKKIRWDQVPEVIEADAVSRVELNNYSPKFIENMREKLKDNPAAFSALQEAYLQSLPDTSVRKAEIKRKSTMGFSKDIMQAFAVTARGTAYRVSSLKHSKELNTMMNTMRRQAGNKDTQAVIKELQIRENQSRRLMVETPFSKGMGLLSEIGFVWFLGSPSYWLVNMTQPLLITAPYLSARYGTAETTAAMARAYQLVSPVVGSKAGRSLFGLKALNKKNRAALMKDVFSGLDDIMAKVTDPNARKMLQELETNGLIDMTIAQDLRSAAAGTVGSSAPAQAWDSVVEMTRIMPQLVEVLNRTVTALSAFELEMSKSKSYDAAQAAAMDAVRKTQFNYSAINKPRIFSRSQAEMLRPIMLFKQYAQNMLYLLITSAIAARPALMGNKRSAQEKAIARKTLGFVLGSHTFATGTLGGIFVEPVRIATWLAFAAAKEADLVDDHEDFDTWVQNITHEAFGDFWGKAVSKGVPYAMGVDLHNRIGLDSLLFMGNQYGGKEGGEWLQSAAWGLLGPLGSTAAGFADVPRRLRNGDVTGALRGALPKGLRDVWKSMKYAEEGVLDGQGNVIMNSNSFNAAELAIQAIGFTPSAVSHMYERRGAMVGAERAISDQRQRLLQRYRRAEAGNRGAALNDIVEFNSKYPEFRITGANRIDALRNKRDYERRAKNTGGYGRDLDPRQAARIRQYGDF